MPRSQEQQAYDWLHGRSVIVAEQILYTNLNMTQHQIKYAVIHKLSSPPPSPKVGQIYYDTTRQALRVFSSSGWTDFGGHGYTFVQSTPATTWVVQHNLSKLAPEVLILDNTGAQVLTTINFIDANNLQIVFGRATSGTAYLE